MARPRLMLLVGSRGGRTVDTCRSLTTLADVVVVTSAELLGERADTPEAVGASELVCPDRTDAVVAAAVRHAAGHPVHGVLTFSDDMVETTAVVADALGLPGQPLDTVAQFRDKSLQRAALERAGLPVPAHVTLRSDDAAELAAALLRVPLPAILKPTRGSGGVMAFVVTQAEQLQPLVTACREQVRRAGAAFDDDTAFLLESLIVGARWHALPGLAPYVSVESVAIEGRFRHLAVTDRFPQTPPVAETGMLLPSSLDLGQQDQVVAACEAALRACGFRHGLAHTEIMLTAAGPVVIEVNARAGGALPYLFPLASDVDLTVLAGRVALGELPDAAPVFRTHAVFIAPQHPLGVHVERVDGLEDVRSMPGVRAVIPLAVAGASTEQLQNTMIAAVLATVESAEAGIALHRDVLATVRAVYRPGPDAPAHYTRAVPQAPDDSPVRSDDSARKAMTANPA